MKLPSLCLILLPSVLAYVAPSKDTPKVKESINAPRGWIKRDSAPADFNMELRITLPQPGFYKLEQHLFEVSDPDHARYGDHLSKEEVEALITPHPESIHAVRHWLGSHGLQDKNLVISPAKDWVKVLVPIGKIEEMLDTKYHIWEQVATGRIAIRTIEYSLPADLHAHIELIHPTIVFPSTNPLISSVRFTPHNETASAILASSNSTIINGVNSTCNSEITLNCLQQIYKFENYTPSAASGSKIALTGYLEQFANEQDLQMFYTEQRPEALNTSFTLVSVNGGRNNQNITQAGQEADLDVQYGLGLTFPLPGTFYSTAGSPPFKPDLKFPENGNEPYLDWLDFVLSHPDPPQMISTSYGDDEQTVPESYARLVCQRFAQLSARGVSLFFGSGDSGVGDGNPDPQTTICKTNDGRNATQFLPVFPASCPYVTTIGSAVGIPEVAGGFSGGGFSNIFARPAYQDSAVSKYLKGLPNGTFTGLFNTTGRAYPDLAAQGEEFIVFANGIKGHASGTSASTPVVAAIFALLNDARLRQGLPVLGFLNPLLYKIRAEQPNALNDITTGSNPGCGTQGFNATEGWDPVTGLGTPNFDQLKDIALSLK